MGQSAPRQPLAPPVAPLVAPRPPRTQPHAVAGSGLAAAGAASRTRQLGKQPLGSFSATGSLPDRVTSLEVEVAALRRELAACRSELAALRSGGSATRALAAPPEAPLDPPRRTVTARHSPARPATRAPRTSALPHRTLPGLPPPALPAAPVAPAGPGGRPRRQRPAPRVPQTPAGDAATTLADPGPVPVERTLLVRIPASASGRPSLEQLVADLRDVEADFCARLARTSAQRIALWPTSVGESWWVD